MKRKKFSISRKRKSAIGITLCILFCCAHLFLANYKWTEKQALKEFEDYYATGAMEVICELGPLPLKNDFQYNGYLLGNKNVLMYANFGHSLLNGWIDGFCSQIALDENQPVQVGFHTAGHTLDSGEEEGSIFIFGYVTDPEISSITVPIYVCNVYDTETGNQVANSYAPAAIMLSTDDFIDFNENRIFYISHRYDKLLSHQIDPYSTPIECYNSDHELIYSANTNNYVSTYLG